MSPGPDYTNGAFSEARQVFAIHDGREFIVQRFHAGRRGRLDAMTVWAS